MPPSLDPVPAPPVPTGSTTRSLIANLLSQELTARRRRRPHYSLRASARDLGVSASFLCEILAGKANPSHVQASRMGVRLSWDAPLRQAFEAAAAVSTARSPEKRLAAKATLETLAPAATFNLLDGIAFEAIAGWEHMALLEALEIPASPNGKTISALAARFGLDHARIARALERLETLGLATRDTNETWTTTERRTITGGDIPSEAVRAYHAALLRQAAGALEEPFLAAGNRDSRATRFWVGQILSGRVTKYANDKVYFDALAAGGLVSHVYKGVAFTYRPGAHDSGFYTTWTRFDAQGALKTIHVKEPSIWSKPAPGLEVKVNHANFDTATGTARFAGTTRIALNNAKVTLVGVVRAR